MRSCGTCTKCCTLLPVRDRKKGVDKGANTKCRHQSFARGCAVYGRADMPNACRVWSCRWLLAMPGTERLSRPDRAGYVIDVIPDVIVVEDHETGQARKIEVVQIWLDPKRPDAHRDPALLAYLEGLAARGIVALCRRNERDAFTLVAPSLNTERRWLEVGSQSSGKETQIDELVEALGTVDLPMTSGGERAAVVLKHKGDAP